MSDDKLSNPHDQFVKYAFSNLEDARDLMSRTLPADVLAEVDLATLAIVAGSFVDVELRERHSDLLFQLSFRGGENGFVYILFEHKSFPDPQLPFQLLRYIVRIWEGQLRDKVALSPIIPLILYHGLTSWNTSRTMQDIVKAPAEMVRYVPQFDSILIDLSQYSHNDLRENALVNAFFQVLKYVRSDELPERLPGIMQLFVQIIDEPRGLECLKAVLVYLSNSTDKISPEQLTEALHLAFSTVKTVKTERESPMPTIAEQWIQQGLEQGLEKGREEGLQAGIRVVLELRFPDQANAVVRRIAELHSAQLLAQFLELCKSATGPGTLVDFLNQVDQD